MWAGDDVYFVRGDGWPLWCTRHFARIFRLTEQAVNNWGVYFRVEVYAKQVKGSHGVWLRRIGRQQVNAKTAKSHAHDSVYGSGARYIARLLGGALPNGEWRKFWLRLELVRRKRGQG
jgi:hypothetical protein